MTDLEPRSPHDGMTDSRLHGHGGHHWMMIACCIPMLLIAAALVITGVANAGAIVFALVCMAMMAVMMAGRGQNKNT
jgi:hypothetical protein